MAVRVETGTTSLKSVGDTNSKVTHRRQHHKINKQAFHRQMKTHWLIVRPKRKRRKTI